MYRQKCSTVWLGGVGQSEVRGAFVAVFSCCPYTGGEEQAVFTISGFYNEAIVYAERSDVDDLAIAQIKDLLSRPFSRGSTIRIMSDVHSGAGCVIGTTMTIDKSVVPNLVGVDIGCGLVVVRLGDGDLDRAALDAFIRRAIPSGFSVRTTAHPYNDLIDIDALICQSRVDASRARLSLGTLGGGNHFIEVNVDQGGRRYLAIHSGSRHIGLQVATHYQKLASGGERDSLAALTGSAFDDYIHDMQIMQRWADLNRQAMADQIIEALGLAEVERFSTIHNYIDTAAMILRKGAVSARMGERLIIPLNMRDGSLLCVGRGNAAWNYSAPHGAGRLMSRKEAKRTLSLKEYRRVMGDIYTTSVSKATLDESPEAYKSGATILAHIGATVDVIEQIRPIYNYKAAE